MSYDFPETIQGPVVKSRRTALEASLDGIKSFGRSHPCQQSVHHQTQLERQQRVDVAFALSYRCGGLDPDLDTLVRL